MTFKKQFKKTFSYTWYLYVLAIVVPSVVFPLSYSFMHRPKQNQILSIFVPGVVKNSKAESLLLEKFKDLKIRNFEILSSNPDDGEYQFSQKLSVVAYNRCDVMIVPEDRITKIGVHTASIELTSEVKNLCKISDEKLYKVSEKNYGVQLPDNSPINDYVSLKNSTKYYAFLNSKSWNIGSYSIKSSHTENAFKLMQFVLGK